MLSACCLGVGDCFVGGEVLNSDISCKAVLCMLLQLYVACKGANLICIARIQTCCGSQVVQLTSLHMCPTVAHYTSTRACSGSLSLASEVAKTQEHVSQGHVLSESAFSQLEGIFRAGEGLPTQPDHQHWQPLLDLATARELAKL